MSDMLQKSSTMKTIEPFFTNPTKEYSLKDLTKKASLAHTSTRNNLQQLITSGMVLKRKEKKGKRLFPLYLANRNNLSFRRYKLIYNLNLILESGVIDFIQEKFTPKSIVLFGSYARGEDIEASDIDLFIECKKEEIYLRPFEKKLNRKIELHFNQDFVSYSKELKNNIINGIVLSGFLEGYK